MDPAVPCNTSSMYAAYRIKWKKIEFLYRALQLQGTETIQSYELNFHPVLHGVSVSCRRYTVGFAVCYGRPSDVFAASSGFMYLYTLPFKEKEKRASVVTKAIVHKQGSVQRFKFAGKLEFSVGQWVV